MKLGEYISCWCHQSTATLVSVALQGPGMGVVCSPAGIMPSGHEKER